MVPGRASVRRSASSSVEIAAGSTTSGWQWPSTTGMSVRSIGSVRVEVPLDLEGHVLAGETPRLRALDGHVLASQRLPQRRTQDLVLLEGVERLVERGR